VARSINYGDDLSLESAAPLTVCFSLTGSDAADAFTVLYEAMHPRLLGFFARRLGDRHGASDLASNTFARAFEMRGQFRGSTYDQASAWLWSIARTELAQHWRTAGAERNAIVQLTAECTSRVDDEHAVHRACALAEAYATLEDALMSLSEEQCAILRMRFVEGLSHIEISRRLRVSGDAARARMSRAVRALRASGLPREAVLALTD
jgi:RNA polymerase sigma-70 factor (ECF subfamily)